MVIGTKAEIDGDLGFGLKTEIELISKAMKRNGKNLTGIKVITKITYYSAKGNCRLKWKI